MASTSSAEGPTPSDGPLLPGDRGLEELAGIAARLARLSQELLDSIERLTAAASAAKGGDLPETASATVTVEAQADDRETLLEFADTIAQARDVTSLSLLSLGENEALFVVEVTRSAS